jgi:L-ribulose-5-phosphate 3-epimerase
MISGMAYIPISARLGVCSWSLRPDGPEQLVESMQAIGLKRIQCALDPMREKPSLWKPFPELCRKHGLELVSGMFGTVGEDYSTLESIHRTGGVVPDHHWEENWRNIQATVPIAQKLGLKLLTFHAGFLPHEATDPAYVKLLERITRIAQLFAQHDIQLTCETGQESGVTLKAFLDRLNQPNVGVNFDPANMILYDKGDPIDAMRVLGRYIRQCHIKDATRTRVPGTWGAEVVVGTGEVRWADFFKTLQEFNFAGYCCIEREAGDQRVADIRTARQYVEKITQPGSKI